MKHNVDPTYMAAMAALEEYCINTIGPEEFEIMCDILAGMPMLDQVDAWHEISRFKQHQLFNMFGDGHAAPLNCRPGFVRFLSLYQEACRDS